MQSWIKKGKKIARVKEIKEKRRKLWLEKFSYFSDRCGLVSVILLAALCVAIMLIMRSDIGIALLSIFILLLSVIRWKNIDCRQIMYLIAIVIIFGTIIFFEYNFEIPPLIATCVSAVCLFISIVIEYYKMYKEIREKHKEKLEEINK